MKNRFTFTAVVLLFLSGAARADDHEPLDLHSIPISDWLNAGEHSDIPWTFIVRQPYLRIDQRLELSYTVRLSAKNLNRAGKNHELFLVNRISTPDGEWLTEPQVVRHSIDGQLPSNVEAEFLMRAVAQPGEYRLWAVLYDRQTGKHNVARRLIRIPEIHGDPLPDLYQRMPLVEFLPTDESIPNGMDVVESSLYLPVRNKRKVHVELISMLNAPEQWTGRVRVMRAHTDSTLGTLSALSHMELTDGSLSITGLDLVRRQVIFEQHEFESLQWAGLMEAMKRAQTPNISTQDLQGAKNNGAFFRDFLNQRLTGDSSPDDAMRVLIVVTSSWLFENGSDLRPLQIERDCNCRVYYLRFRLTINDVFDQLDKLMKPLHPRIFNLMTARDLRKAIAEIVEDLGKL